MFLVTNMLKITFSEILYLVARITCQTQPKMIIHNVQLICLPVYCQLSRNTSWMCSLLQNTHNKSTDPYACVPTVSCKCARDYW